LPLTRIGICACLMKTSVRSMSGIRRNIGRHIRTFRSRFILRTWMISVEGCHFVRRFVPSGICAHWLEPGIRKSSVKRIFGNRSMTNGSSYGVHRQNTLRHLREELPPQDYAYRYHVGLRHLQHQWKKILCFQADTGRNAEIRDRRGARLRFLRRGRICRAYYLYNRAA
jgi:hypothetical protein